jgi:hypothetical protein
MGVSLRNNVQYTPGKKWHTSEILGCPISGQIHMGRTMRSPSQTIDIGESAPEMAGWHAAGGSGGLQCRQPALHTMFLGPTY